MICDAVPERGALLGPDAASAVMTGLGIPADPFSALRVRHASGARVRLRSGRLLEDGSVLAAIAGAAPPPDSEPAFEGRLRCEWLREYLPRAMPPGIELLANVQFRNAGQSVMPGAGEGRVTAGYAWAQDGSVIEAGDIRTPLPGPLAPGQILTLAMRLKTPDQPGRAALTVRLVQEGVRWLEPSFGPFQVDIREGAGFVPPPAWVLDGPGPHDPCQDRARAKALMRAWIAGLGVDRPRVLELGGGARPAAAGLEYDLVNVDGDLLALQLGRLVPGEATASVCTGYADLPLAEAAFDAIVGFGALRAMPDPAATLRNLRAHLRPGGFIGLFCEPVGHMWPGSTPPAALAELKRGLNPQAFSVADYARIFCEARLRAMQLVVDGSSLKARLQGEGADA